jgi:hypothetical protein
MLINLTFTVYIILGAMLAGLLYIWIFKFNRIVITALTVLILMIGFDFYVQLFSYRPHHCNCKAMLEGQAYAVEAAIADYFSVPTRCQVPTITELVNLGCYTFFDGKAELVKESEFTAAIVGDDVKDITIVISSKAGRCPFVKGECSWSKGEFYVKKMDGEGQWFNSYYAAEASIDYDNEKKSEKLQLP